MNRRPLTKSSVIAIVAQALAKHFCDAIGLHGPCTITLKTSMSSTESWKVHAVQRKNMSYRLLQGWRLFCSDNSIELGDICTFTVIETTLWHVIATRCKETINHHNNVSSILKHMSLFSLIKSIGINILPNLAGNAICFHFQ